MGRLRGSTAFLVGAAIVSVVVAVRADPDRNRERSEAEGGVAITRGGSAPRSDRDRAPDDGDPGFEYTVVPGDTLSHIALRFHVSQDVLLSANPGLTADRIRVGRRIRIINGLRRVAYSVRPGESLGSIAARHDVSIDQILSWNPGLSRDAPLRAGRELVVYTAIPESRSESVGTPADGSLRHSRRLPEHPAFVVRAPERAFGTDEAVRWIVAAFEHVHREAPELPPVEVHDLSLREGGRIEGHHSHESGRDADIAYYQVRCGPLCAFRPLGPDDLDAAHQWALFSYWIERGQVDAIFVDHALQAPLYESAREAGVSRANLSRYFQYPRAPGERYGVIRHHPRHADHFHVRFVCHHSDNECG